MDSSVKTYTYAELKQFLTLCSEKGWMPKNTADSLDQAASRFAEVFEENERSNVCSIDAKHLVDRYHNLHREVNTGSLRVYRSRLTKAISEFCKWRDNPTTWKYDSKPITQKKEKQKVIKKTEPHSSPSPLESQHKEIPAFSSESSFSCSIGDGYKLIIPKLSENIRNDLAKRIAERVRIVASLIETFGNE